MVTILCIIFEEIFQFIITKRNQICFHKRILQWLTVIYYYNNDTFSAIK